MKNIKAKRPFRPPLLRAPQPYCIKEFVMNKNALTKLSQSSSSSRWHSLNWLVLLTALMVLTACTATQPPVLPEGNAPSF